MFGDKHSYNDFGLILSSKTISPPKAQINTVKIPLRDGSVDLTESLTNDVKYEDRKLSFTFTVVDAVNMWSAKLSEIENYLHGQKMRIVIDDDASFYYTGRVEVNNFASKRNIGTLVIDCKVEPYKYDIMTTLEDCVWDVFDFETGFFNDANDITVDGSVDIVIVGKRKQTCPIITANAAMTVTHNGTTYDLIDGTQKMYDLIIQEGENVLTFTGSGVVSVEYRGGSL